MVSKPEPLQVSSPQGPDIPWHHLAPLIYSQQEAPGEFLHSIYQPLCMHEHGVQATAKTQKAAGNSHGKQHDLRNDCDENTTPQVPRLLNQ